MRTIALAALSLALGFSAAARADRMPIPADAPPAFKVECGSCHMAFPPGLLPAADWRQVMAGLDKHYGDNASLDDKTRRSLEDFLVRYAGSESRYANAGSPPRLTATSRFQRKHREIPARIWRDSRVKSAANCTACHSQAEAGSFSEREINVPGLGRWEGD